MIDKFPWDAYSDQPHIIKDKAFKKSIYKKAAFDQLLTLATTLILAPLVMIRYFWGTKPRFIDTQHFFAMGVTLDKNPQETPKLIEELGVKTLLIRLPLCKMDALPEYVAFVQTFQDKDILINILQDRAHIEDKALLQADIRRIFQAFPAVKKFQIGNAINRKKWAFYTIKEYLIFYQTVQDIRDKDFSDIQLLGSGVIDFEFHYTLRSLFHFFPIRYDIFTSLLYVDRRGSPQNAQMGFDLDKKIALLTSILKLSFKTTNSLYITECNWPLSNTAPYAPTSEKECVSPELYALYMVQYYLICLASGHVDRVYWHQLIAPGYGLIDNREGIKKYPAFTAYKTMIKLLEGATLLTSDLDGAVKSLHFQNQHKTIMISWSDTPLLAIKEGLSLFGEPFKEGNFCYQLSDITVAHKDS